MNTAVKLTHNGTRSQDLSQLEYHALFEADYERGLVRRRVKSGRNCNMQWNNGYVNGGGYRQIRINKSYHYLHRILWIMKNGEIPERMTVDHINGNRADNRMDNLRIVSQQENNKNTSKQLNTSSKHIGVSWHKAHGKWYGQVRHNGVYVFAKYFTDEDYAAYYIGFIRWCYGFHDKHGKQQKAPKSLNFEAS